MKNIALFGGSNSVMANGLATGLKQYANIVNFALGGSTAIQNLYELNRDKNQQAIKNADIIITESNLNEITNHSALFEKLSIEIILRNIQWFYESLARLNKPVCVLILPFWRTKGTEKINNIHRYFANLYGFYVIDLKDYYDKNNLRSFGERFEHHQLSLIYRNLGKNIAKNIDDFKNISKNAFSYNLPEFKIITPNQMIKHGEIKSFNPKNSNYNEMVFRLEKGNFLELKEYSGYKIIATHSWLLDSEGNILTLKRPECYRHSGSLFMGEINNKGNQTIKHFSVINFFCEIQAEPIITNNFILKFNDENLEPTEFSDHAWMVHKKPYFDLISLFICTPYDKLISPENIPDNEIIKIENDFSYLIPDITFFNDCMEFIDEYINFKFNN